MSAIQHFRLPSSGDVQVVCVLGPSDGGDESFKKLTAETALKLLDCHRFSSLVDLSVQNQSLHGQFHLRSFRQKRIRPLLCTPKHLAVGYSCIAYTVV